MRNNSALAITLLIVALAANSCRTKPPVVYAGTNAPLVYVTNLVVITNPPALASTNVFQITPIVLTTNIINVTSAPPVLVTNAAGMVVTNFITLVVTNFQIGGPAPEGRNGDSKWADPDYWKKWVDTGSSLTDLSAKLKDLFATAPQAAKEGIKAAMELADLLAKAWPRRPPAGLDCNCPEFKKIGEQLTAVQQTLMATNAVTHGRMSTLIQQTTATVDQLAALATSVETLDKKISAIKDSTPSNWHRWMDKLQEPLLLVAAMLGFLASEWRRQKESRQTFHLKP